MAKKRYVNTKFWEDNFVMELLPDERLLFLYFLTSPLSNIAGIYECPIKMISAHTGFEVTSLQMILKKKGKFDGKVHYIDGWVYIRNFVKHQSYNSPKVQTGIDEALKTVPVRIKKEILKIDEKYKDDPVNVNLFSFDDVKEEQEATKEQNSEIKASVERVVAHYQSKIRETARTSKLANDKIALRLKEFSEAELIKAIDCFAGNSWRMRYNRDKPLQWFFDSEHKVAGWFQLDQDQNVVNEVIGIKR